MKAFLLVLPLVLQAFLTPDLVETQYGDVQGTVDEKAGVRRFLGIPFTDKPARFAPPGKITPWAPYTFDATFNRPCCWQVYDRFFPNRTLDEDCLHLNVVTPLDGRKSYPVMVYIHGGGLMTGDASDSLYDPDWLVVNEDVIVVNINYRLSAFGFFYHESFATKDYPSTGTSLAFIDQIAAIEWVQDNIAVFGGDPENIIIFGESAGATSVCMHLVSPLSRKRLNIKGAIMESGACNGPWGDFYTPEQAKTLSEGLMADLNVTIEELLTIDPAKINNSPKAQSFFAVDGYFLDETAPNLWKQNKFWKGIPIFIGTNSFDGMAPSPYNFHGSVPTTKDEMMMHLRRYFDEDLAQSFYDAYDVDNAANVTEVYLHMNGDSCVSCPSLQIAQLAQKTQQVWMYDFALGKDGNSCHGAELPLVFHNPTEIALPYVYDENVANLMSYHWTNFAKKQSLYWKSAANGVQPYIRYNQVPSIQQDYKPKRCALVNSLEFSKNREWCGLQRDY